MSAQVKGLSQCGTHRLLLAFEDPAEQRGNAFHQAALLPLVIADFLALGNVVLEQVNELCGELRVQRR